MMEVLHTRKASLPNFKSFRSHNVDYIYQRRSSHCQTSTRTEPIPIPNQRKTSAPTILEDVFLPSSRVASVCSDPRSLDSTRTRCGSINTRNELDDDAIFVELINPGDLRCSPCLIFSHHPHSIGNEKQNTPNNLSETSYFPLTIPINPHTHHIIEVYQLNDRRILIVMENYWTKCTEIYLDSIKNIIRSIHLQIPFITLNTQCHLMTLNQVKSTLALYDIIGNELFLVSYATGVEQSVSSISFKQHAAHNQMKVRNLLFVLGTDELCFVESTGSLKIFDLHQNTFRA